MDTFLESNIASDLSQLGGCHIFFSCGKFDVLFAARDGSKRKYSRIGKKNKNNPIDWEQN